MRCESVYRHKLDPKLSSHPLFCFFAAFAGNRSLFSACANDSIVFPLVPHPAQTQRYRSWNLLERGPIFVPVFLLSSVVPNVGIQCTYCINKRHQLRIQVSCSSRRRVSYILTREKTFPSFLLLRAFLRIVSAGRRQQQKSSFSKNPLCVSDTAHQAGQKVGRVARS